MSDCYISVRRALLPLLASLLTGHVCAEMPRIDLSLGFYRVDAEVAANQAALEAAGHWGVPTMVFEGEPFFGQDRFDVLVWRLKQRGLRKRA